MDAAFPVLERISYKKVSVPCGFSNLYAAKYRGYFQNMPGVMKQYDQFVFHASQYRDIDFAREHGFRNYSVIPNGASFSEFSSPDKTFRQRYNIPADIPLLLTVGSHTGFKGHQLVLDAFRCLKIKNAALVIIGNNYKPANIWSSLLHPMFWAISKGKMCQASRYIFRAAFGGIGPGCLPDCRMYSRQINQLSKGQKRVILLDPARRDVVAALHAADLFVFGSNIEYSPLVLFEAMAAGTPFISLACGNAVEIAALGGGGIIAPTIQIENGMVDGEPGDFASSIENLLQNANERSKLAQSGHAAWLRQFTWEKIALQYEKLYQEMLL
jgi:glycosyltransferase involved in cell wall biosynthesis